MHEITGSCSVCKINICKAFVEGEPCHKQPCRYVHPAFALTSREPPPSMRPVSIIVRNAEAWSLESQEKWEASRRMEHWNLRVIDWNGTWICQCGNERFVRDYCRRCESSGLCLAYLKGHCSKINCRFEHPPFELDLSTKPKEGTRKDDVMVVLTPESMMWRDGHAEKLGGEAFKAAAAAASGRQPQQPGKPTARILTVPIGNAATKGMTKENRGRRQSQGGNVGGEEGWYINESTSAVGVKSGGMPPPPTAVPYPHAQQQQQHQAHSASQFPPLHSSGNEIGSGGGVDYGVAAGASSYGMNFQNGTPVLPPPLFSEHAIAEALGSDVGGGGGFPVGMAPPYSHQGHHVPQSVLRHGTAGYPQYSHQHHPLAAPTTSSSLGFLPHLYPAPSADSTNDFPSANVYYSEHGMPDSASSLGAPAVPAEDDYSSMLADLGIASEGSTSTWRNAVMHSVDDEIGRMVAPGLVNKAGEYNCFLNVVIQCLWHCNEFRSRVMTWHPAVYQADPVVHSLRNLFDAFARQEQEHSSGIHTIAAARTVVNPSELREALALLPGRSFGLGEMNDAAELLMTLYSCAHEVGPEGAAAVDATFGLRIRECVRCPQCTRSDGSPLDTHQNDYVQYFFNVSATALRMIRAAYGAAASTAQLLRQIEEQTMKTCDSEKGGCDRKLHVRHTLVNIPAVFTLQLAWETNCESPEDIRATLDAVQEKTKLGELYADVEAQAPLQTYWLRAAVAYYGAHYSAFVYSTELQAWVMFDDSAVSKIGTWADVVRKCQIGRIQPSVLFYNQR